MALNSVPPKLSPLSFVKAVLKSYTAQPGLPSKLLRGLSVTDAELGKVNLVLQIIPGHTNRVGHVHGGTIASLVDIGGSLAVASTGLYRTGVSTDLSVTYMASSGQTGDTLHVTAKCDRIGSRMAFTTVTLENKEGYQTARGSHTKFIASSWGGDQKIPYTIPEDDQADVKADKTDAHKADKADVKADKADAHMADQAEADKVKADRVNDKVPMRRIHVR